MHISKNEVVHFIAIMHRRSSGILARIERAGYGYAVEEEYNNLVHINNGIDIFLVHTSDIDEVYPVGTKLRYRNQ